MDSTKRTVSPSFETSSPSRRKLVKSDETGASTATDNSETTKATASTRATTMEPDESKVNEMDVVIDEDYYQGLRGKPRLLARGSRAKQIRPEEVDSYGNLSPALKKAFHIGGHAIAGKLDSGLRQSIIELLLSMKLGSKWISVDFVRLGYAAQRKGNPVVVLVAVEAEKVTPLEAKRIVDDLEVACNRVELYDVDIEVMDGNRMISSGILDPHEPLPDQDDIPLVGSSIALFREHDHISSGRGTLGGYIEVDGEIFGLTNQHVCLGPFRVEAYPSGEESKLNSRLYVSQPAEQDLEDAILDLTKMLAASREQKASHHRIAYEQSRLDEMKVWAAKDKNIGYVYQTSGLRVLEGNVGERFKMDWAIIKLDNTKRFPDPSQIINRVPPYSLRHTDRTSYLGHAYELGGKELKAETMPSHLKRALSSKEARHKRNIVEANDKSYIVWKFGRSTHHTCGVVNDVTSIYNSKEGLVSDEWLIIDKTQNGDDAFSKSGDSGSFVWDSDGFVVGLLWGGKEQVFGTYVTPIETLFEDIKNVCGAREVKIVVRPDEDTVDNNKLFEAGDQSGGRTFAGEASTSATGIPDLFGDGNDFGGFAKVDMEE
ncbi:uncharacterized protein PAC_03908 [Phialocephala subalpina]|uniref:Serine protease n=1 Tax=Phialocephala subalpina TaxID=576137 RepID=A0A1L7WMM8_9HELO|nr:uncharacterized protein PAC_03908 [Phialocephala subalpina]